MNPLYTIIAVIAIIATFALIFMRCAIFIRIANGSMITISSNLLRLKRKMQQKISIDDDLHILADFCEVCVYVYGYVCFLHLINFLDLCNNSDLSQLFFPCFIPNGHIK